MATIVTHNNFLSKKNDESFISISCKKMKQKSLKLSFENPEMAGNSQN